MRVKTGITRQRRHKKILKRTKGYRMSKSKLYRVAHEAYMHAGQYSYEHRRRRTSQMRRIWIDRINSAARAHDMNYSQLMKKLKDANVAINKKMLSEMAFNHPEAFSSLIKSL